MTNNLVVVSSKQELEQTYAFLKSKHAKIIAVNLSTENYIRRIIPDYQNPLYDLILKDGLKSKGRYLYPNFQIADDFCDDNYYRYILVRFGYFLMEIDRSLDFAERAIRKNKPKRIFVGEIKSYGGSSVAYGNLVANALHLQAKSRKIPLVVLRSEVNKLNLRRKIGEIVQFVRSLFKQKVDGQYDLVLLAPPSKLAEMSGFVKDLSVSGIRTMFLTYDMTFDYQRKLRKILPNVYEKERLITFGIESESKRLWRELIEEKRWKLFRHPKYERNKIVASYLRNKLKTIVDSEMNTLLKDLMLADEILSEVKPGALLTLTDPDAKALPYVKSAKKLGIKTITIQHGADFAFLDPFVVPESEYYISWSKLGKKWISAGGVTKSKVLIGQSPFHSLDRSGRLLRRPLKRNDDEITILILGSVYFLEEGAVAYYQESLFRALENLGRKINIIVRTHPFQNRINLEALIGNSNLKCAFDKNIDILETMKGSDVVIFESTTAGLDAMLAGKPVVFFNPYDGGDFFNLGSREACLTILNEEDITNKLIPFIRDRKLWDKYAKRGREFAMEYLGLSENRKRNKIVDIILNLLDQRKSDS